MSLFHFLFFHSCNLLALTRLNMLIIPMLPCAGKDYITVIMLSNANAKQFSAMLMLRKQS